MRIADSPDGALSIAVGPHPFAEVRVADPTARKLGSKSYRLRFAECKQDLDAVFRLRFLVFNLELGEGLESSYKTGHDTDQFDSACDHLIVEHSSSGEIIGTYRMQSGRAAARNLGYYSAREFDFRPYEPIRDTLVELGRACIHRTHRSFEVLTLLWRGIATYALAHNAQYLIGCSSLSSQCPEEGFSMYWRLHEFLVEPALRTRPHPEFAFPIRETAAGMPRRNPPRLLRSYLSIGAQICGEPAMDREFMTIDFLTLLDLDKLAPAARARFLSEK